MTRSNQQRKPSEVDQKSSGSARDGGSRVTVQAKRVAPEGPLTDGWRYPSNADIARLYNILNGEGQTVEEDFRNLRGWAVVGTTGIFEYLDDRHREEVQGFTQSHPVHLPTFPELGDTPPHPSFSLVNHMTVPSASAVNHTTALELGEENMDMGTGMDAPPLIEPTAPADALPM
jgi:hypothetical protein